MNLQEFTDSLTDGQREFLIKWLNDLTDKLQYDEMVDNLKEDK